MTWHKDKTKNPRLIHHKQPNEETSSSQQRDRARSKPGRAGHQQAAYEINRCNTIVCTSQLPKTS